MVASGPDAALYGIARQHTQPKSVISPSSSLAFTSQLSSLLSASTSKSAKPAKRSSSTRDRDDIFSSHNRGAKKRALNDIDEVKHSGVRTQKVSGTLSSEDLARSKAKMAEKVKIYNALKRGEVDPKTRRRNDDFGEGGLVDFDKKWADQDGEHHTSSSDNDSDSEGNNEPVSFEDEFGRTRTLPRREYKIYARRLAISSAAAEELSSLSARPSVPTNLISGDTIQTLAFNPDSATSEAMASLASRRDRSATPPEAVRYDETREMRSKGVGFYRFSRDEAIREQEMESLKMERGRTENKEAERRRRREEAIAERRERVKKRGEVRADEFLRGIEGDILGGVREEE